MNYAIAGVNLFVDLNGRNVVFAPGLPVSTFSAFLDAMGKERLQFSLYDPVYPSPSDPGAYMSYSPWKDRWQMTLGNHGWSGGIYDIGVSTIVLQLFSLYSAMQLGALGLDKVSFFSHYKLETPEKNSAVNELLEQLHK